jgi:1-acyl-sn-glycerol-3-phosphate acyltransferase
MTSPAVPRRPPSAPGERPGSFRDVLNDTWWRAFARFVVHGFARVRIERRTKLPRGPVVLCFNHLNWSDPIILMAALPWRPRFAVFGPKEEDMTAGGRNRLMAWTGLPVPYKPGKNDLLDTARRVQAVFDAGWSLAIAGEGRIHRGERELLPLNDGPAYFALRAGVPVVPLAINGTSWLGFRRTIRIRYGDPIPVSGRPTREAVDALTAEIASALRVLVADFPDPPPPGRFGRWFTEKFNEWPEGRRPPLAGEDSGEAAGDVLGSPSG